MRITQKIIKEQIRNNVNMSEILPGMVFDRILNDVFGSDEYDQVIRTMLRHGLIENRGFYILTNKGYRWI